MNHMKNILLLSVVLVVAACQRSPETRFRDAMNRNWQEVFSDNFDSLDNAVWHLDGKKGALEIVPDGLVISAGNAIRKNSDHVVLWNRNVYKGDIRIEYDFTRLDTCNTETVNIIYLHATGSGKDGYDRDIMKWNEKREIPAMETYFNHMNLYHISYAVEKGATLETDYVRARRYIPETGKGLDGTALSPEYEDTGLFEIGVRYHITVVKSGEMMFMEVAGDSDRKLFHFDLSKLPGLDEGRVGLRQMWGRKSKYDNFRIFTL